jgi:UDP-N-acetylmuramoyl-tripeptide--D-alanyl-D-alanine ligase
VIGALDLLSEMPGRRLALLGDMRELGELEFSAHQQVGEAAARCCNVLHVAGELGKIIGDSARTSGLEHVYWHEDKDEAVEHLSRELREGDYLLVKASRAMEFDVAVSRLAMVEEAA